MWDGNSYANGAFHGKGVDGADDTRMKAGKAAVHRTECREVGCGSR